jgi:hypothetical protein
MNNSDYDIIVAGGGTAGSAAAVAAARRGCRVLLLEEQNCLGGISTSGCVGEWFASLEGMGNIFDEIVRELEQFGVRYRYPMFFNPEYLKAVWQLLAERAGVDILFHASACGVTQEAGGVTAVQIVSCSKALSAQARYFIDATGEGDLCALAGALSAKGDPDRGRTLHMTLTAWMYDTGHMQKPYLPEGLEPIRSEQELPGLGAGWRVDGGRVYMNATKVMGHDPTDPFSLSQAEREARRQLIRIAHFLQSHAFPTYALAASGAKIGIREGRRIMGDYCLKKEEVLGRTEPLDFPDGVAVATSQIDFHSLTKAGNSGWRQRVECYAIPFRCLITKGFRNLLMAGKCISTDQVVQSSCRMTPTCCAMGQAAGTATALAVGSGATDIRQISIADLRAALASNGLELNPRKHTAFAPHDSKLDGDDGTPSPPA